MENNTFGRKVGVALTLVAAAILGAATPSFATTPDVQADVTAMATSAFGQALPILLAVAGAAVGLAVAFFGAKLVLRSIRKGGGI